MTIGTLLDRGSIAARVTATTKQGVLGVVAEIAARNFGLRPAKVLDALLEREATAPTGVGKGIAVPHAQVAGLTGLRGIFVRLEKPVEFGAVDEAPVDLIFAILAPPGQSSDHLRALARVTRILRRPEIREQLRVARGADAIYALLAQEVQSSAA
jgi:PTS system nitrogen regulatory IIA component